MIGIIRSSRITEGPDAEVADDSQGVAAVRGGHDVEPRFAEGLRQNLADVDVIVDDEHGSPHHGLARSLDCRYMPETLGSRLKKRSRG